MEFDGIDLTKIANIYPSILVRHGDVVTTVSIEWYEQKSQELEFEKYVLIFLDTKGRRIERYFSTKQEMDEAIFHIQSLLKK